MEAATAAGKVLETVAVVAQRCRGTFSAACRGCNGRGEGLPEGGKGGLKAASQLLRLLLLLLVVLLVPGIGMQQKVFSVDS